MSALKQIIALIVLAGLWCGGCVQDGPRSGGSGAIQTYVRGVYAYESGDEGAIDTLREAIQQNPQLIMPRILLGKIYKDKGDYAAAIEYLEGVTRLDPHDPEHRYNLGVSYQMIQRLQEAASSYQAALKINPNDFGSNMNLGLVYLALGDIGKAVQYAERATELRPDSAEAHANLAVTLDSAGQYARAENAYRRSLEMAPAQAGTLINYANNLLAQQKWQDAVQVLNAALKLENTPYLQKRLGDAYAMGGQLDTAIQQYQVALKANPKYYSAMNEQARVLIQQYQAGMELQENLRDQALGLWRQSLEINSNQPNVRTTVEQWEKRMFSK